MEWVVAKVKTKKQDDILVWFRVAMTSSYMLPRRANIPVHDLDRQWEQYQVLTAKLEPSIGAISPAIDLHGRIKHSGETYQLKLASGSSKHAL